MNINALVCGMIRLDGRTYNYCDIQIGTVDDCTWQGINDKRRTVHLL
jgi:hypothetical protein